MVYEIQEMCAIMCACTCTCAYLFKETVHSFLIFWKELWPLNIWNFVFAAEVLARDSWHICPSVANLSAAAHICTAAHLWQDTACAQTISRLHLLVWPHEVAPWLYHKVTFTWLTNTIKHTIKPRSSELKLDSNPHHLAEGINWV